MSNATYQKLKSGEWGIRCTSNVSPGDRITVAKKSGETKVETVTKVVWSGQGVWLAAIAQTGRSQSSSSGHRGGGGGGRRRNDGYAPVPGCAACRQLGRMCKRCEFDEYDM